MSDVPAGSCWSTAATTGQLGCCGESSMPAAGSGSSPGSMIVAFAIRSPATIPAWAAGPSGTTAATTASTGMARPSDATEAGLPMPAVSSSRQVTSRGRTSTVRWSPAASARVTATASPTRPRNDASRPSGSPTGWPSTATSRSPATMPAAAAGEPSCTALMASGVIAMPVSSRGCGGSAMLRLETGVARPLASLPPRSIVSVTGRFALVESAASSSAYDVTATPSTARIVSPPVSAGSASAAAPASPREMSAGRVRE